MVQMMSKKKTKKQKNKRKRTDHNQLFSLSVKL